MKERIAVYLLLLILCYIAYQMVFNTEKFFKTIREVEFVEKRIEQIKIEGRIVIEEKEVPFVIALKDINTNPQLDLDNSFLPDFMLIDRVSFTRKRDWLTPIRVGIGVESKGLVLQPVPILSYSALRYKDVEFGMLTNFQSIGINAGYKYRNMTFGGYYLFNNTVGGYVGVQLF